MTIRTGIAMLEISAAVMGRTSVIYPSLLWQGERVILVDTGYPGQLGLLQAAMEAAGQSVETLTDVIITHQDIDHIGGLPALIETSRTRPAIWASEIEQPYIQGEQLLVKITPDAVEHAVASLPKDVPDEMRAAFRHTLLNPPKGPVDRLIGYGQTATPIDDIVILNTPGHTPGHISIYHRESKTLIAGDALVIKDGRLHLPDAGLNSDNVQALDSLKQLDEWDIEGVICYHGGYYKGDVHARIRELLEHGAGDR